MRKRVYLVNISFGLAGIERRFANLWQVLHRRGSVFPILVIPSVHASQLREAGLLPDQPGSVLVVPVPGPIARLGDLRLPLILHTPRDIIRSRIVSLGYQRVWREIARDPGAILHIGMPCSALRPPDVPAVYECVDATFRDLGSYHFRLASRRRCIVHCQTDRIRFGVDAHFATQAPRWKTIANPTYFADYGGAPLPGARDAQLVAFVGRLHAIKNPLLFIEAVAIARHRGCDCRGMMLGEGPLQTQVEALITRYGLQKVISLNFHSYAPSLVGSSAIYVSLQTDDNYGSQALLEAMGAGCAIIASEVGHTGRIVTDEVGVRVPLTADAVARAIESLVGSPERTRHLGATAAHIARTQYSPDVYAAFLESLYERAAQYHRASDSSVNDVL